MHIHILGICGTFMGGVAQLARAIGHRVTGCDAQVYPPMSDQLQAAGIDLIEGFETDQLALKPDLWVIGNVVRRGTPLMEAILNADLPYVSGPAWVGDQVLRGLHGFAVAGTHGKTTTSSMLAWVLEQAGLQPGFLIGGVPQGFGCSARLPGQAGTALAGRRPPFVIEADEYDTAFFDKRSKFVHYRPRSAILNNLEFDHADIFTDLAAIETQFHHLVRTVPAEGQIIANASAPALQRVLDRGCWSEVQWFEGDPAVSTDSVAAFAKSASEHQAQPPVWRVQDATGSASSTSVNDQIRSLPIGDQFTILHHGEPVAEIRWALTGQHNRANALAVMAAAVGYGVPIAVVAEALNAFSGVKRRLEVRGEVGGVRVVDDFAHHPTAIATTLAGLKQSYLTAGASHARILAVFEPRSNTMKLGTMRAQLPAALVDADAVFCYTQGLDWDAAETLSSLKQAVVCGDDLKRLVDDIAATCRAGDTVLVMSNGSFGGIHQRILDALAVKFAAN